MPRLHASEAARAYRDDEWLKQTRAGVKAADLAAKSGVSRRTVQLGVKRARDAEEAIVTAPPPPARPPWWLDLVPLFPITSFTPQSKCPHHGPIRPGSLFCCMVCSRSGVDDDPALRRDPLADPRPEPVPKTVPFRPAAKKPATRKERRKKVA